MNCRCGAQLPLQWDASVYRCLVCKTKFRFRRPKDRNPEVEDAALAKRNRKNAARRLRQKQESVQ